LELDSGLDFANFGQNWLSGSGEETKNVKSTVQTEMGNRRSELNSPELKAKNTF
jgi:hypothetical protein